MATAPTRPVLADFFLRLADDPDLLAEYLSDPRAVLERAGLNDDQIEAVLDGSPEAARTAVEGELVADPVRRRLITTPKMVVHAPEPKPEPDPDEPEPDKPKPKPPRPS